MLQYDKKCIQNVCLQTQREKKDHSRDLSKNCTIMNLWGPLPRGIFCNDHLNNYHLLKKELCCIELLYEMFTSCCNVKVLYTQFLFWQHNN